MNEEEIIDGVDKDEMHLRQELLGGFNADEYGNIVEPTQETVTDSQLSTTRVFDPDETQIPGRLE